MRFLLVLLPLLICLLYGIKWQCVVHIAWLIMIRRAVLITVGVARVRPVYNLI
jgi:hypothetical protein